MKYFIDSVVESLASDSVKYNKLVRDRIPEIIEETGKKPVCEVLGEKQTAHNEDFHR